MWLADTVIGRTIYLDANVFIYAFEGTLAPPDVTNPASALRAVFHLIQQGRTWARTSQMTRAEVLVHPLRNGNARLVDLYSSLLSGTEMIAMDAVSTAVIDRAARLRADFHLRLADAIHLASAIESGCDALLTADKRLAACSALMAILPLDAAQQP
ncbi:MAG: PIN domain-containing protein [Rhodoferax sp.]|nr:PIN domain-containing protein [Rhodoferax sp.]